MPSIGCPILGTVVRRADRVPYIPTFRTHVSLNKSSSPSTWTQPFILGNDYTALFQTALRVDTSRRGKKRLNSSRDKSAGTYKSGEAGGWPAM